MIKKFLAVLLIPVAFLFTGCISEDVVPVDLTGTWVSADDSPKFEGTFGDNSVEIYIVSDDIKGLYWKGTFPVEENTTSKNFEVVSEADVEALNGSMLGSGDETKKFTYDDGKFSFDFTIMGTTKTVTLQKK